MTQPEGVAPVSGTAANPAAGRDPHPMRRVTGLVAGLAVFGAMMAAGPPGDMPDPAWRAAAVGLLMAVWWVMEALPIAATALVPVALFPLLGIADIQKTTAPYANPLIFLFLGGFTIALAMERWNLHKRIALGILRIAGMRPPALVGGFMAATAFLSMWVSNTATAAMMLPISLSVITLLQEAPNDTGPAPPPDNFALALLLGIAYGASIGGVGTLIGTPPNALLAGFMAETYGIEVGFGQWMLVGVPLACVLLLVGWGILTKVIFPLENKEIEGADAVMRREVEALGPMSHPERMVLAVFVATALAWIFRPLIDAALPGLTVTDPGIAVTAALVVFALPADMEKRQFLLDWRATQKLPWGVLILVGGGLSLGAAIGDTGLSRSIAQAMETAAHWPLVAVIIAIATTVTLISHLTSNTATAAAFLPLITALAVSMGENPLLLAVPAVLAASCAFMMPVATPPNAIVFASGMLTIPQMVRAGFWINVAAVALITLLAYTLLPVFMGVELGHLPAWAR